MIYVVAHKMVEPIKLNNYQMLQVGYNDQNFEGFLRDNTKDNIAEKNANFCELTALYWIWKNTDDDYKGLVHYRRFFGKGKPYEYNELVKMLESNDIVLPKKVSFHVSAKEEITIKSCTEDTLIKLRESIKNTHLESLDAYDKFFNQNKTSLYNMLFCKREIFDDYASWLFDIIFDLEPQIDLDSLNDYQKRIYGFLSERLLNVWVEQNNLKVKHIDVLNTEMSKKEKLALKRRNFTNEIRYKLTHVKRRTK